MIQTLRYNKTHPSVTIWRYFLRGEEYYFGPCDNDLFDRDLVRSTKAYQKNKGLDADGIVGNKTWAKALEDGLAQDFDITEEQPGLVPLLKPLTWQERLDLYGTITYVSEPQPHNPEAIHITNDWEKDNIVTVDMPDLGPEVKNWPAKASMHKKCVKSITGFFQACLEEDLHKYIKTFDGLYVPRFVRGSRRSLSNHSWGTAFDINAQWNMYRRLPARSEQEGTMIPLVELAEEYGLYWRGFANPTDGMHFEVVKPL